MHQFKRCALVVGITGFLFACAATQSTTTALNNKTAPPLPTALNTPTRQSPNVLMSKQGLNLEQIMADPDWIGNEPEQAYWSDDSQQVIYRRKQQGMPLSDLWIKSLTDSGNGQVVTLAEQQNVAYKNRVMSADKKVSAWIFEGNIFIKI